MPRRTTRKTVDYSHFSVNSDSHESDDDFQHSSVPHPSKKAKRTALETSKGEKKNNKKQAELSAEEKVRSTRKSRDEKQFEKELQQALDISRSQSHEGVSSPSESRDVSKDASKAEGITLHDDSDNYKDENKENGDDDDFCPSNDDTEDDEDEEENFCVENESDDKFYISKGKKRKLPVKSKNSVQKKKPNDAEVSNRNATKVKGTQQCSTSSSSPAFSAPTSKTPILTQGTSSVQPRLSTGLTASVSPSLGGIVVKNARPGGLRLGLSRNVRVTKPLHSNANFKYHV